MESQNKCGISSRGRTSRVRPWALFCFFIAVVWIFGAFIGPYIRNHVPQVDMVFDVIEEQGINSNAYFYTEIEASGDAEAYLMADRELPGRKGLLPGGWFFAGVGLTIAILWLGFKYMPLD